MGKAKIIGLTKSAQERIAKGDYKKSCAKGCACGVLKKEFGGKPEKDTVPAV